MIIASSSRKPVLFLALSLLAVSCFSVRLSAFFDNAPTEPSINAPFEASAKEAVGKEMVHKESVNFAAIDIYAQRVPQHIALQSLPKLVAYLTKPATNDIEKARAIARWITSNVSYDFESAAADRQRISDNADSKS